VQNVGKKEENINTVTKDKKKKATKVAQTIGFP